ncbi:diguanylate cyclase domain-containing protein [Spongisporangium articulatum]|uniref:Diguanylate cyclase domain-containing protein n=1 Tax=Spongisporangium articulatum TaxID=3362603 RepID=A0ABW8AKB9_9ACTN
MRSLSGVGVATRLWCAIAVPLLVAGAVLGSQFLSARGAAEAARDELVELHVIGAMMQLQAGPVQPEVLALGPFPPPGGGSRTRLRDATVRQIWSLAIQNEHGRIAIYQRALARYPDAVPAALVTTFDQEVALLQGLLAQRSWPTADQIATYTELRARADTQLADLGMSLATSGWVTYQEGIDVDRTSTREFFTAFAVLADLRNPGPNLVSMLSGARANAVAGLGLGSGVATRQRALDLTRTPQFLRFETDMARAVQVAAGAKPPDDPWQLSRTAVNANGLHDEITEVANAGRALVEDGVRTRLRVAQENERRAAVLSLLVLLATAAVGAAVLRSVLRPLRALTVRAADLAGGALDGPPVTIAGRHELSELAVALEGGARTLHKIREQSEAIAGGRLDDPCLDESAPGPLGAMMHRSVEAVRGMAYQLRQQADLDALTGLMNRNALEKWAAAMQVPHVLFYLDLDGFKRVNDTQGHQAGDQVLSVVADRLQGEVGPADAVARLGGDEFLIVARLDTDGAEEPAPGRVAALVERFRATLSRPVAEGMQVGVSIGWTLWTPGESFEAALTRADLAMYERKRIARTSASR